MPFCAAGKVESRRLHDDGADEVGPGDLANPSACNNLNCLHSGQGLGATWRFESAAGRTRRQIDSRAEVVGSKDVQNNELLLEQAFEAVHVSVRTWIGLERSLHEEVGDLP